LANRLSIFAQRDVLGAMSTSDDQQLARPQPETLDLLFDLVQKSPDEQLRATDAVDSKIFQSFAAASVLIGLATVRGVEHKTWTTVFVSVAVAALLVVAYCAIRALWSRKYRAGMAPPQLWNSYWDESTNDIKHAYVVDIATGHATNEGHIADKHRALRWTLVALLIEAAAIGAALIVSAV
jgi:hypothetical protein